MKTTAVILGLVICLPINIPVTYSQYNQNEKAGSIGINYSSFNSLSEPDSNVTKKVKSYYSLPDLQCSFFWWESGRVTEKHTFWVSVKVNNAGAAAADPSHVKLYLSTDNDWDLLDDYFLVKQSVDSLFPGDYDSIQWNFIFPDIGSGNYPVWIIAISDCDHEVIESDENNIWKCNSSFKVDEPPEINVNSTIVDMYEMSEINSKQKSLIQTSTIAEYTLGLTIPENVEKYNYTCTSQISYSLDELLDSVDWSSFDSPVKNQDICASCWAFASVALIENLSNHNDLSEQVIISCAGTGNCMGGWVGEALQYIGEIGIPHEEFYPYIAEEGNCPDKSADQTFLVKVSEYDYFPKWSEPDSNTIYKLKALLQNGPVVVSMRVPDDNTFKGSPGYTGGIYNYNGGIIPGTGKHAVLVVGYNDKGQFFRAKNSWGEVWGESGYFRIAYDDVTDEVHFGGYACTASGVYTKREGDEFILSNIGRSTLEITNICSSKSWLNFNPTASSKLSILPGDSVTIDCMVDWKNVPGPSDTAIVTINSNDPDDSVFELKVIAVPNAYQIPDSETISGPSEIDLEITEVYNDIVVYPNPASDFISIKFSSDIITSFKITLIDNIGKIIYMQEFKNIYSGTENKIDISGLNYGIYFLKIDYKNGSKTEKIIKK
jgi:C1A family cysteine protease